MIFTRLLFLYDFKLLLDFGLKKGKLHIENTIRTEIDTKIRAMNESIEKMQKLLVIKFILYTVALLSSLIIRRYIVDSEIPLFLISCIYIFILVLFFRSVFRAVRLYRDNKFFIKTYLPKYLEARKGLKGQKGKNKKALTILINDFIEKEIVVEKREDKSLKGRLKNVAAKFARKNKKVKDYQKEISLYTVDQISEKMDGILKKRLQVYALTFVFYLLVVYLSKEFIIKFYYQNSFFQAFIYPFKYVIKDLLGKIG
jgi:hypothetical protein